MALLKLNLITSGSTMQELLNIARDWAKRQSERAKKYVKPIKLIWKGQKSMMPWKKLQ